MVTAGMTAEDLDDDDIKFQLLQTVLYADYRSVLLNQPSGAVPKA
jgi:hypothetical protein